MTRPYRALGEGDEVGEDGVGGDQEKGGRGTFDDARDEEDGDARGGGDEGGQADEDEGAASEAIGTAPDEGAREDGDQREDGEVECGERGALRGVVGRR